MNRFALHLASLAGMLLFFATPYAFGQPSAANKGLENELEAIRKKNNLPALAGAIVNGDGLVQIAAAGFRKAGSEIPVTVEDQWHLGSDTKAMTAAMIGTIVDEGKLKWDSTIGGVFPELAEGFPAEFRDISLLELLSHRAGLQANLDWRAIEKQGTLREQRVASVKEAAKTKLLSKPGDAFAYSNLGYVIAGAMAERAADQPWEELMTNRVFIPLGMHSAGFGGTGTPGKLDQPWGHLDGAKPVPGNGPKADNALAMGPAGTVHCSLPDWAKFIADQLQGAKGKSALLKPETFKMLHTPAFSGAPPFGGDYASGWIVVDRPWGGGKVWNHAGSNTMNSAVAWVAPEKNFAVLACTNQAGPAADKGCDEAATALIQLQAKLDK